MLFSTKIHYYNKTHIKQLIFYNYLLLECTYTYNRPINTCITSFSNKTHFYNKTYSKQLIFLLLLTFYHLIYLIKIVSPGKFKWVNVIRI